MKILLVEDMRAVAALMTARLSAFGYEVCHAENGQLAVDAFAREAPDLVLMDLEMPVMNGLEALKIIHHQNAATKVIMITALASRELFTQATNAGAKGYIIKPFHPDRVTQSVSRILAS